MDTSTFYKKRQQPQRFLALSDAVNYIASCSTQKVQDLVVIPPDSGDRDIASDEEDANDEQLDVDDMPGEVAGELEVQVSSSDSDTDVEVEEKSEPKRKRMRGGMWKKTEDRELQELPEVLEKIGGEHMEKSEYEIFSLFFGDDVMEEIMKQTELYAQREKNDPSFATSIDEVRQFLGILLLSGYHVLPAENDYWSTAEDLCAPIFSSIMKRDRFKLLKTYLHLVDNQALEHTKVANVAPFY